MPRVIDPAIISMLESSAAYSVAILVNIEFPGEESAVDGPLRFTTKLDNIEFNGETYFGAGSLGSVSMPESDGELSPATYKVELSGISDEILEAVAQVSYMNHKATAYIQFMDADYNDISTPQILWQGLTDGADISIGKVSTVVINVRDRLADWARAKLESYTNGDQIRLHPSDKGFEFVSQVGAKDMAWPEAEWF